MGRHFTFTGGSGAWLALGCGLIMSAALHAEEAPKPSSTTPTRHEIWVPTKDLQEVLKKHPNAVLLDRAQYEALVRDAGKLSPSEEKLPPMSAVVEEVRVWARVAADATTATLTYEYHLRNLRDGWCELTLPFSLTTEKLPRIGSVQSLIDVKTEKPLMVSPEPAASRTKIATRGDGRHVLSLVFSVSINSHDSVFSLSGFSPLDEEGGGVRKPGPSPLVAPVPTVRLELPPGMSPSWNARKLADGAWEVIPRNSLVSHVEGGMQRTTHKFSVTWSRDTLASSGGMQPTAEVATLYRVMADKVMAASVIRWSGNQPPANGRLTLQFPREARVLFSTHRSPGTGDQTTVGEGKVEFDVSASRTSRGQILVLLELPVDLASGAVREVPLPSPTIEGMLGVQSLCAFLVDPDVRLRLGDFGKLAQPLRPDDARALKEAIPFGTESRAQILPVPEFAGAIPAHPNFMGGFRFDTMPANSVIQVEMVPDRFSVDADALVEVSSHEVNLVRTLVFHGEAGSTSRAVVTLPEGEVFLEVPVNSGEAAIWKQVGRDIEVTWPKGLAKEKQTALTVRTRRDIAPQAADGSATDKIAVASIPVSGASRVSGYVALKFDESWKVNVTDTTGLETRDARATPVRGRMAWFGLKDWKLGFDLSRRAPVHDATVTAYALPRAKQVEIEGQITLSVTGAPLRKFEVKLPPAIAPLLRVTSPLVGEQSLDAATGVWTFTLGRELMGTGNVRFRMSLPAESVVAGAEGSPVAAEGTLTALLPDITLPGARRMAGRWVVEANTDTELAFATRGVQPIDARRPPAVEGYAPQHRVIAAYGHGGGEHEIRLTATRHDPATLAGMVLVHLRMTSVLGQDGSARHEAVFTLRHNGRQFATVRLPEGAGLLSAVVDGKAVKPVKAGANEVRLPLVSRIGDAAPVEVKVMYDTPSGPWGGSGGLALTPPTLGAEVPVMETAWKVFAPAGFTLRHDGSGLEEERVPGVFPGAPGMWEKLFGGFNILKRARSEGAEATFDFLAGGSVADFEQREAFARQAAERLNRIILPKVQFNGASMEEAIEFLRIQSKAHDHMESDPAKRGVSIIIKPGAAPSTATISLDLTDVPFMEALRYVTELGGMKYKIERTPASGMRGAVVVVPISDVGTEMYVRKFKLSLAQMLALQDKAKGASASAVPADPFKPAGEDATRQPGGEVSALDTLRAQGIPFPEGSLALYDGDTQMLLVKNTRPNLDLVESVVEQLTLGKDLLDYYETAEELQGMPGAGVVTSSPGAYFADKMRKIIFPAVQFNNATPEEAVEFLRIKSKEYDRDERDPAKKGVNLIIKPGSASSTARISLDLKDVPMVEALRYVTELAGMKYRVEPFAVVVLPISDVATEMYTRTFKVPPDFAANPAYRSDMQEETNGVSRRTALDILGNNGPPAPEGASATFIQQTSQLIVRNTQANLDKVEAHVNKVMADYIERRRNASLNRTKSGLVPLELELPTSGQVMMLNGHQRPKEFTLHYLSWERQMARTSLLILLGATFFWVLRGGRVWLCTFAAGLVLTCVPILLLPSWSAACHALLLGWLLALAIWLLWRMACWWKRRTEAFETVQGREVLA